MNECPFCGQAVVDQPPLGVFQKELVLGSAMRVHNLPLHFIENLAAGNRSEPIPRQSHHRLETVDQNQEYGRGNYGFGKGHDRHKSSDYT